MRLQGIASATLPGAVVVSVFAILQERRAFARRRRNTLDHVHSGKIPHAFSWGKASFQTKPSTG